MLKLRLPRGSSASLRFLGQSSIYGVGRAVSQIAGIVLLPLYLSHLTPEEFGVLAVSQMLIPVMLAIWTLGLEPAVGRFYYEYQGTERDRMIGTTFTVVRLLSLVGLILTLALGPWIFPRLVRNAPYFPHIFIVTWTAFFQSFAVLPLLIMRMREEAHRYIAATTGTLAVTVAANVYFLVVRDGGVVGILLGNFTGAVLSAVGYLWYLRSYMAVTIDRRYARRSFQYTLPMLPELVLGSMVQSADRFLLDKFVSPSAIGLFSVARQFGNVLQQFVLSLKTAYTPLGFKVWSQERAREYHVGRMSLWFVLLSSLAASCVILFSREIMLAIGKREFYGAIPMIPLAVLAGLFLVHYYVYIMAPLLSDRVRPLLTVFLVYAGALIGFNLVLILTVGVWGALIANAGAAVVRVAAVYLAGEFQHRIGLPVKETVMIALPAVILAPVALMDWDVLELYWTLLVKFALLLVYAAVGIFYVSAHALKAHLARAESGGPQLT